MSRASHLFPVNRGDDIRRLLGCHQDEIDLSGNKIVMTAADVERLSATWSKKC